MSCWYPSQLRVSPAREAALSRHPFSQFWKGPLTYGVAATVAFVVCVWSHSYFLAFGTLIVAVIAYAIYYTGESSDLPGTAGKGNKNIPT